MFDRNRKAMRRLQAEDLMQFRLISEAQISPDGSRICFVQTVLVPEQNKYRAHLWMVAAAGGDPEPFTQGDQVDLLPAWSPDGKRIAFVSSRSGSLQVWVIPAAGGEARKATAVKGVKGRPVWAPDSGRIAFTVSLDRKGLQPEEEDAPTRPPRERYTADVRRITTLPFKENGVGIISDKFDQIAVLETDGLAQPRVLTKGDRDHAGPVWSPDGRYIAFAMSRWQTSESAVAERIQIGDIGLMPAGGAAVRKLTKSVGPAYNPAFSPDGRMIAYIGHARQYGDYTQPSLWLVGVQEGEPRDITARFDRPLGDQSIGDMVGQGQVAPVPAWAPDGRSVYCLASDSGMSHLVRIATDSGTVTPATSGPRVFYSFSLSRDGRRAAVCHADAVTPNDVSVLDLGHPDRERRLTEVNRALLSGMALAAPERYTFPSGDVMVEGWILRPPERKPGGATPAVLEIHGGPMVMYSYRFFFEFQLLAASGITVVYANPRGSMGYGQAFLAAIRGDWGNNDFQDVMNAIDAAVKRGRIDANRLGIAGGSYGGFMVNWAIGHTDRFTAAIAMRSISNEYSMFGTSDFGFTNLADFGGPPWRIPEVYRKHSPISYVEQVNTPLLMIHSEQDLRTPMSEAEQFYTALKFLGREVTLLRYPGEDHNLSRTGRPWHRVHRLEEIVSWFVRRLL